MSRLWTFVIQFNPVELVVTFVVNLILSFGISPGLEISTSRRRSGREGFGIRKDVKERKGVPPRHQTLYIIHQISWICDRPSRSKILFFSPAPEPVFFSFVGVSIVTEESVGLYLSVSTV